MVVLLEYTGVLISP